jgi:hypothetical protein
VVSRTPEYVPPALEAAAHTPPVLARLERLLIARWDPDGAIRAALADRPTHPDPTRPRTLAGVASEVAAILAAGGGEPDVSGYLKREELALFGPVADEALREARRVRREFVRGALWRAVRGISRPDDLPEATPDGPS